MGGKQCVCFFFFFVIFFFTCHPGAAVGLKDGWYPYPMALYDFRKKVSELYTLHNLTILLKLDLEKKCEICKVLVHWGPSSLAPMGATWYNMNNSESAAPKDDSCQVWLKSNHAFLQEVDETVTFYIYSAPSPTCYPPRGPLGPPWELSRTIFIIHLRRYLHFI